ncbi:hypothetical protein [Shimazuella kribbensis]|uniref:hypothetical protein n=1 Tax=Shimazuella kribbensis TaxID=139808 RepID=UPI0003FEA7BE|nr:hypothetical protein [Shimazuella kribbensis]
MIRLVQQVSTISKEYLIQRLPIYDTIWLVEDSQGLQAFQLIQNFHYQDRDYLYFGPLFSKGHQFLPLFLKIYFTTISKYKRKPFFMITEIQNPQVILVFKTLFWNTSFPKVYEKTIPDSIVDAVACYVAHCGHISSFDLMHFKTTSSTTLYQNSKQNSQIVKWLQEREVFLDQGDSQILIVEWQGKLVSSLQQFFELSIGLYKLKHWSHYKRKMLSRFERRQVNE